MKTQRKDLTPERVLPFLQELKVISDFTTKFSMRQLLDKHSMPTMVGDVLRDGKIIKNIGGHSKSAVWVWTSPVNPNIKMAQELINRARAYSRESNRQKKKQSKKQQSQTRIGYFSPETTILESEKIKSVDKTCEDNRKQPKKISILWGLYTKEY